MSFTPGKNPFSLRCYFNRHAWIVTHRTKHVKLSRGGPLGMFLQGIWGPGLGFEAGTFGNYALQMCKRCQLQQVCIEHITPGEGSKISDSFTLTKLTVEQVEAIQYEERECEWGKAPKKILVNLKWIPVPESK